VTGGHGAVGTAFARQLLARGAERVSILDAHIGSVTEARVVQRTGSVLDRKVMLEVLAGCDTLVHLAATTSVEACAADPLACFDINVAGTAAALDACVRAGIGRIVFTSSAHVYGRPATSPVPETHPLRPESVYACSKAAAELVMRAWTTTPQRKATIVRFGNIYGPGTAPDTVIASICRQAVTADMVRVRGLAPRRDFLFIEDAAEALVRLIASPVTVPLETFNVSGGIGYTIGEAVDIARQQARAVLGRWPSRVESDSPAEEPDDEIVLDVAELQRRTGWRPATPLEAGIRATIQHDMSTLQ
jgi:UDP-glucose 4-epimerase